MWKNGLSRNRSEYCLIACICELANVQSVSIQAMTFWHSRWTTYNSHHGHDYSPTKSDDMFSQTFWQLLAAITYTLSSGIRLQGREADQTFCAMMILVEPYVHVPMRLHSVVPNYLITWKTSFLSLLTTINTKKIENRVNGHHPPPPLCCYTEVGER
jgi:hypothetical protein